MCSTVGVKWLVQSNLTPQIAPTTAPQIEWGSTDEISNFLVMASIPSGFRWAGHWILLILFLPLLFHSRSHRLSGGFAFQDCNVVGPGGGHYGDLLQGFFSPSPDSAEQYDRSTSEARDRYYRCPLLDSSPVHLVCLGAKRVMGSGKDTHPVCGYLLPLGEDTEYAILHYSIQHTTQHNNVGNIHFGVRVHREKTSSKLFSTGLMPKCRYC